MTWTLIPFGQLIADGRLVDVHDVKKGRACACICPSCQVPLIARKGESKEWHFAHESRGTHKDAADRCKYSVFVAIKLMSRQLLEGGLSPFTTPPLELKQSRFAPRRGSPLTMTQTVTPRHSLKTTSWQIEPVVNGTKVDALTTIADYSLAIVFSYPGVSPSSVDALFTESALGVLKIDLEHVLIYIRKAAQGRSAYKQALAQCLQFDIKSKSWLYHPRSKRVQEELQDQLDKAVALLPQLSSPGHYSAVADHLRVGDSAVPVLPTAVMPPPRAPIAVSPPLLPPPPPPTWQCPDRKPREWAADSSNSARIQQAIALFICMNSSVAWTAIAEKAKAHRLEGTPADQAEQTLAEDFEVSPGLLHNFLVRCGLIAIHGKNQ